MKRKLINFVVRSIDETGIQLLNYDTSYYKTWRLVGLFSAFTFSVISTVILSIVNTEEEDLYRVINPIPYVALGTIIIVAILTIVRYRKTLSEMLHQMDEQVHVYEDEDLLDVQYEWYLDEQNLVVAMIGIFVAQLMPLAALCIPAIYEFNAYRKIESFVYPGWSPWRVQGLDVEVATLVWQILTTISGLWINQVVIVAVLIVLCEYLRQYKRLKRAIRSLEYRTTVAVMEDPESIVDYDEIMRRNIISCVQHLQKIRKNFHLFEPWFTVMISCELAVCAVSLAVAVYLTTSTSDITKMANLLIVIFFININLLARCLIGEIFFDLNDGVANSIFCDIDWYSLNKEHRRLLLMFHQMACQPLTLFAFRIFAITRVMFGKIVRTTYSVFNVLKISLK